MLSGYEILLHRLCAQSDLTVGVISAGQTSADYGDLVGHCVNVLPVRRQLDGTQSAKACLAGIRETLLDAFEHRNFTYGTLLSKLNVPRDPSRAPLLATTFNLDPAADELQFAGLDAKLRFNPRRYETFDLFFNCLDNAGELTLEMTYNSKPLRVRDGAALAGSIPNAS